MKRGPFKHLGGNQKPWSGCNGKLKEDKAMGEKLGGFFGLVFIIMGLWKVSISVALCGWRGRGIISNEHASEKILEKNA